MHVRLKIVLTILVTSLAVACSVFDSGVEWRGGPYSLVWIDTAENVSLVRRLDDGNSIGRVDATVFSVGWDGRYVVAKQHPAGDRKITNYYIVDSHRDSALANVDQSVIGPLTEEAFRKKARALNLPEFSKTLASLE
ncbi:MAG TPA: hypothetical protein VKC56_03230 [Gallionellaceae bacterium]|nr:hypothetical protein [Gallionellaceae bacterium]